MSPSQGLPQLLARRLTAPVRRLARRVRYEIAGGRSGALSYGWTEPIGGPWVVEARFDARVVDVATGRAFCGRQTLPELRALGFDPSRPEEQVWRLDPWPEATSRFLWMPALEAGSGALDEVEPWFLEAVASVLLAEDLQAVCLHPAGGAPPGGAPPGGAPLAVPEATELTDPPHRDRTVFAAAKTTPLRPMKWIGPEGLRSNEDSPARHRRGPYLFASDPGPRAVVHLRDASKTPRLSPRDDTSGARTADEGRTPLLVTAPFFARGGAEHTLLETLRVLTDRYDVTWATLAPHDPARGDRRDDFAAVSPRLLPLGDLVHPAAMPGLLRSLLDSTGAKHWYNANGTTLFYDFAPSIARERPALRIVDHLYDHRVGYIDRYDAALLDTVDACVAENHRIAETLEASHGWPRERAPVVWPCGRPRDALPSPAERERLRSSVRAELGLAPSAVVFLTAARLHPQKRPLDLVELARRVRDLDDVELLLAGGGDLGTSVEAAIRNARADGARIRGLGLRDDVPRLLAAVDVGCLVSEYEGLPVFLLECLQMGLPFLGTDVGELGRVLRDTGAGVVVDRPGDLDALEAGVRRLADPTERARLARRAADAGERFDVERCAARYASVFEGQAFAGDLEAEPPAPDDAP